MTIFPNGNWRCVGRVAVGNVNNLEQFLEDLANANRVPRGLETTGRPAVALRNQT
jgi:hypothetical protein